MFQSRFILAYKINIDFLFKSKTPIFNISRRINA